MAFIVKREFGLPDSITIAGGLTNLTFNPNQTYYKTNTQIDSLAASTNGSYNYQAQAGFLYITSPLNQNVVNDYSSNSWVFAFDEDSCGYYIVNPSTDKFNFPTNGWIYQSIPSGPNDFGNSGPALITITTP